MKKFLIFVMIFALTACSVQDVPKDDAEISKEDILISEEADEPVEEPLETEEEPKPQETPEEEQKEEKPAEKEPEKEKAEEPSKVSNGEFAKNYYADLGDFDVSEFYLENSILEGRTVDFERAAELFVPAEKYGQLREKAQFDAFMEDAKAAGGIWDMFVPTGIYFAQAGYENGEKTGVTLKKDGNGGYAVGQIGGTISHLFPENKKLLEQIDNIYDADKTEARCVSLTRFISGILITDGTNEHFIVLESTWDFKDVLKAGTMGNWAEILEEINALESVVADS